MYTQSLALRCDLLRPQSLTHLHDHIATWLGLGAALNIARKPSIVTYRIIIVTSYLLCIFGLHNTIPSVLNIVPLESTLLTSEYILEMTPCTAFDVGDYDPLHW
jgi:hypothetical protein